MLPKKKPSKTMVTVRPTFERSSYMIVKKIEVRLAKVIATMAIGERLPYVQSVSGPRIHVPNRVAISYAVRILAID